MNKEAMREESFCFKCSGKPKYELSLRIRKDDGTVEDGPFWPLCHTCFVEIPWEEVLHLVVKMYEEGQEKL